MKQINIKIVVWRVAFFIVVASVIFCFSGCFTNKNNDKTNIAQEEIQLNLDNYNQYFVIQEEIISYDSSEYVFKYPSGSVTMAVDKTKAKQMTKISIIQLKQNITFADVELLVSIDDEKSGKLWTSVSNILKLSHDGLGIITLIADFDNESISFKKYPYAYYKLSEVKGSIKIFAD